MSLNFDYIIQLVILVSRDNFMLLLSSSVMVSQCPMLSVWLHVQYKLVRGRSFPGQRCPPLKSAHMQSWGHYEALGKHRRWAQKEHVYTSERKAALTRKFASSSIGPQFILRFHWHSVERERLVSTMVYRRPSPQQKWPGQCHPPWYSDTIYALT